MVLIMGDWSFEVTSVPSDGSCFFTSVSIAMNDSMKRWILIPTITNALGTHWERYKSFKGQDDLQDNITSTFIRFMSASAIDEISLEMYNEDAMVLKLEKFKTPQELARHVISSNCWADQAIIRSFMRSMMYNICVVLFDYRTKKPIFLPKEWTFNKMLYICLMLKGNHYTPIRLVYKETPLDMCVSRQDIKRFMSSYNNEYKFEEMY